MAAVGMPDPWECGPTHGLIVRQPWAGMIAAGRKTWEIRGRRTRMRGWIAVIAQGSGTIVGACRVTATLGPLSIAEYRAGASAIGAPAELLRELPYAATYAWCLEGARAFAPVPYAHPAGAVTWVRLDGAARRAVAAALAEG